jgi:hypothetical protein
MVDLYYLPERYKCEIPSPNPGGVIALPHDGIDFNKIMEELENKLIEQALQKSGGNKKERRRCCVSSAQC